MADSLLPVDYVTPAWPALLNSQAALYRAEDIWMFTMWWTIICTLVVYFIAGTWISVFFFRRSKWAACALPGFLTLGFLVGFSVGASLGAVLGAVYQSAEISMSPTIALVWGILLTVIIVMSSLSKSTALL